MVIVPSPISGPAAAMAHPLDEFYARNETPLPPLEQIEGLAMPEPYRTLLVHDNDMTSTLEAFHGGSLAVEVLGRKVEVMEYFREVVLLLESTGRPVEFGAIKIYLDSFPVAARWQILEERWPLGRILKETRLPFSSRPRAFLRLASDHLIGRVLWIHGVRILYGRCNALFHESGSLLAEIVEILPPLDTIPHPAPVPH